MALGYRWPIYGQYLALATRFIFGARSKDCSRVSGPKLVLTVEPGLGVSKGRSACWWAGAFYIKQAYSQCWPVGQQCGRLLPAAARGSGWDLSRVNRVGLVASAPPLSSLRFSGQRAARSSTL